MIDNDYVKLTYTEAIQILLSSKRHKEGKFQYPVAWGIDLQSEHERYLVEKHFKKPVILTNYPKDIKAFYMKLDEVSNDVPGQTVRAMDVLFPGIGEIIGGSQREDNYEKIGTTLSRSRYPYRIYLVVFGDSPVWYSSSRWFRYWFRTFGDVCYRYD